MELKNQILGIDFGGVIIDAWQHGNEKLFFSDNFLETPEVVGAFEAITELRKHFAAIKYVSHCSNENRARFIGWLQVHNFYEATGSSPDDIDFCMHRSDKAGICKAENIHRFIDDRLEILSSLTTVHDRYLFQPRQEDLKEYGEYLNMVQVVESWEEVKRLILE
jgi:hypothetical protein